MRSIVRSPEVDARAVRDGRAPPLDLERPVLLRGALNGTAARGGPGASWPGGWDLAWLAASPRGDVRPLVDRTAPTRSNRCARARGEDASPYAACYHDSQSLCHHRL
jgi:hypothetical protein